MLQSLNTLVKNSQLIADNERFKAEVDELKILLTQYQLDKTPKF